MLNIAVCVKQVIDPEAPLSSFRIDPAAKRAVPPEGTAPVLSPYDENALEAALKIKESQPSRITVISAGARLARAVVKKALAVGADELVLLEDEGFQDLDSFATASVLSAGIRKIGGCQLVLCGRQASDTDAGQVGPCLAELLSLPIITLVKKIVEVSDDKIQVERILEDGFEIVQVPVPAVLTVSSEVGELRFPTVKQITGAAKKPIMVWNAGDLSPETLTHNLCPQVKVVKLETPQRASKVKLVSGADPGEAGINLARALRDARII